MLFVLVENKKMKVLLANCLLSQSTLTFMRINSIVQIMQKWLWW